jgi:cytochrome c oxidase subunit 4
MVNTKVYTVIFGALFVLATAQAALEQVGLLEGELYWPVFAVMMVLSFAKAFMVAGWFQHLKYEPRSVTYVVGAGLLAALALTVAAAYSIT